MKTNLFISIALLFLISCNDKPKPSQPEKLFSAAQQSIDSIIKKYQVQYDNCPNGLCREELEKNCVDTLQFFLTNTLKFKLNGFNVTIGDVDLKDIGSSKAFTATFYNTHDRSFNTKEQDSLGPATFSNVEYWMEFDYPSDSIEKLKDNYAYKQFKNSRYFMDTTINFWYLGELKWDLANHGMVRIRIVPVPQKM